MRDTIDNFLDRHVFTHENLHVGLISRFNYSNQDNKGESMIKFFLQQKRSEGLTQDKIAEKVGVSQGVICKLMQGGDCNTKTLEKIADTFNVSADVVLGRADREQKSPWRDRPAQKAEPKNHPS
jgi:DNA-binding XRE family transcriptional regulator